MRLETGLRGRTGICIDTHLNNIYLYKHKAITHNTKRHSMQSTTQSHVSLYPGGPPGQSGSEEWGHVNRNPPAPLVNSPQGLDYTESWAPKNWCFWTVVLEKTLERPLDCKEIQPVQPKGDQSWVFIGRTDVEAETPILWTPDAKNWLIGKDPDAGKDWGQEEKGTTEDEMVGGHHWLDGWVWVNSGSWWWTGRPGVLQFMGLQRVGHDWATELNLKKLEPETACTQPSDSLDNGIILTHCFKHQNTGWCNMFISKLFFKEWTLNHLYFNKIFSKNNTQH